jgi:peptide/nickel transport system substrate-binding protein/microcin C transport system substrate-binding protein
VVGTMTIVPKHIYGDSAAGSKLNKTLVGSGPYKLEKYDKGQSIVLVKFKDWWGANDAAMKGRWNFERIRLRFLKDSNITIEALKKGDIDETKLTPEEFQKKTTGPEFGKTVMKIKTQNQEPKLWGYIGWNLRRPLFADKNVRLGLYKLMNRDEMNKKFKYGMALPVVGPFYPQSEYADPSVKPVTYDPKGAVELLKKAGWTDTDKDGVLDKVVDGKKTNLSFTLNYANKDTEKYWVLFQSDLRKVGVEMKLQLLDWNALLKNIDDSNFDSVAMSWGAGSVDPDPKQIWHSSSAVKGGSNFIGYKNPEVDKLIDQARFENDKPKRIKILREFYRKVAEDVPYAFLFVDKDTLYARSSKIGVVKDTYNYAVGEDYWWMAK